METRKSQSSSWQEISSTYWHSSSGRKSYCVAIPWGVRYRRFCPLVRKPDTHEILLGVIAQQLLTLPYHPKSPIRLPFRITHLFLIGTRCKVHQAAGLPLTAVPGKPRSLEERRETVRRVIAATLDPAWVEANSSRFEYLFGRVVNNNLRYITARRGLNNILLTHNFIVIALQIWLVSPN